MAAALSLLRSRGPARRFFLAYAQSALGTGISLVALPLVALERYGSPLAVSAVLVAEFLPLMLFASRLGALSDRFARTRCVVAADAVRCAALAGIVVASPLASTVLLAAVTGAATGVWRPAAMTGLTELGDERATNALFGTLTSVGRTGGALLAGLIFALVGAQGALGVDAATFGLSALLLVSVPLGRAAQAAPAEPHEEPDLGDRPRELAVLAGAAAAVALTAGIANVAEPIYVAHDLGAGARGFALVIAAWGLGAGVGSMAAAPAEDERAIRRRFAAAIALIGAGFLLAAAGLGMALLLAGFAVNGIGNGMAMVHERLLVRRLVDERRLGRAFGWIEGWASWTFAIALISSGAIVALAGARGALAVSGLSTLAVAAAAARVLLFPQASCPSTPEGVPHALSARLERSPAGVGHAPAPASGD